MSSDYLNNLIINPSVERFLEAYLRSPAHTLLLSGPVGVGLGTVATSLARQLAGPDVIIIKPTLHLRQKTANINVDDVKSMKKLVQNRRKSALAVVIDDVDKMTADTPESLLKLLEEPSDNVYFILTTHNMYNLPATIVSRSEAVRLLPATAADRLLDGVKPPAKQSQILFMAKGLPAEISRLVEDELYFRTQAGQFADIKQFVNSNTHQRLVAVSKLKTRDEALNFVSNLARITSLTATKTGDASNLTLLSDVIERLSQNGNLKAQLTYLANNY
jgi:MoxR-like ATPase